MIDLDIEPSIIILNKKNLYSTIDKHISKICIINKEKHILLSTNVYNKY